MIYASSRFVNSSIPVPHNAVKSVIFKCAEILMALFVYKLFSLLAARSKQLTSYFMFTEDYIQRSLFLSSHGLSRASIIVLLFSILNLLASLYGTLLWGLDSPGFIFKEFNATVADYANYLNNDTSYLLQLNLNTSSLETTKRNLAQIIGSDLLKQGVNYTLTGDVDLGIPKIAPPTREENVGPRIWLDGEGLSVSTDTVSMTPNPTKLDELEFPACLQYDSWNCTFDNSFSMSILQGVIGQPEIHWDDVSDRAPDSRYVRFDKAHNVWASFGAGGGPTIMKMVFTVTKGKRRHTFLQTTNRATMVTNPTVPFIRREVDDFVRRTSSRNETERQTPFLDLIIDRMMMTQDGKVSYYYGLDYPANNNRTVLRAAWGFFTTASGGEDLNSVIMVTSFNITLLRSETIDKEVEPLIPCDLGSYQNEAYGGKLKQTDCASVDFKSNRTTNSFFGQVDTAAMLIIYGIGVGVGVGQSNISAKSFNQEVATWFANEENRIDSLLIARAYVASINPALVTIAVQRLVFAISGLQLFLSALAGFLAIVAWLGLILFTEAPWSNTFLASLVRSVTSTEQVGRKLGYMRNPPEIALLDRGASENGFITVDRHTVVLADHVSILRADEPSGKDQVLSDYKRENGA